MQSPLFQTERPMVRAAMQVNFPQFTNLTKQHMELTAQNSDFYKEAIAILTRLPDGNQRFNGLVTGIVNYADYLINNQKMEANSAATQAITQATDGFIASLVLSSDIANGLAYQLRANLEQAVGVYKQIQQVVLSSIIPIVERERQGNTGLNFNVGLQPARATASSFVGGGVNPNPHPSFGQPTPTPVGAGGLDMDLPANPNAAMQFNSPAQAVAAAQAMFTTAQTVADPISAVVTPSVNSYVTEQAQTTTASTANLVIHMNNYELHKTFGLLEPTVPSDAKTKPLSVAVLDHQFTDALALANFKLLKDANGLVSKDIAPQANGGYRLANLTINFDEHRYGSLINSEPVEVLKISPADADRFTYTGTILQLFPEQDFDDVLSTLKEKYSSGLLTHDRLTDFAADLETRFSPETSSVIGRKLSSLATNYWRFQMQKVKGSFDSYYMEHGAASASMRNEMDHNVRSLWDNFPRYVMDLLFNIVPINDEGEKPAETFGFTVGYVRVPYRAFELPFGFDPRQQPNESRGEYGMVKRESTPGLYKICKNLHDTYKNVLHHVIITTDGRILEVFRPSAGEDPDRFYLKELERLL